ncbi:cell death activator CIDE-A-like [Arapaima gigas]
MDLVRALAPVSLLRSVSSLGLSLTRHVLPPAKARPFKICTHNRCRRRGVVATSLDDLVSKTAGVFLLTCHLVTLVLEEDGTVVDTEAFFQSLPANTQLMVLERGQKWTQSKGLPRFRRRRRNKIARLCFDLYKDDPDDFIGCLTIRASLYDAYTLSYDIRFTRAEETVKSILRCLTYVSQATGHLLLCGSSCLLQYVGEDD